MVRGISREFEPDSIILIVDVSKCVRNESEFSGVEIGRNLFRLAVPGASKQNSVPLFKYHVLCRFKVPFAIYINI